MVSEEKGPGQIISTHSPTRVLPWKARYYYVTRKILTITKTITITTIKVAALKILKTRYSSNKRQSRAEAKIEYYKVTQI